MQRIALTDGSNTWFDFNRAIEYKEATRWEGGNLSALQLEVR